MDELKDKLKKLSLFGSKSQSSSKVFQGKGHVLGSAPAQAGVPPPRQAPPTAPRPVLNVPQSSRPAAHPTAEQQQQQQPLQHAAPHIGANSSSSTLLEPPLLKQQQQQPHPAPRQQQQAPPPRQQQQQQQAHAQEQQPQDQELAPEGLVVAVGQLASDPHGAAAAEVLAHVLGNVVAAPSEAKFRRLRLTNPRIQAAVVEASGGMELLLACGFEIVFEEAAAAAGAAGEQASGSGGGAAAAGAEAATEGYALLSEGADLAPLRHAVQLLKPLLPPPTASTAAAAGSAVQPPPPTAQQQPAQQQPRPRAVQNREWDPPRERNTQVLLPTSVERDVPDWFFQRTGQELKAAFMAAVRRREHDQVLMTRSMRERLRGGPSRPAAHTHATVKVRFPEGISLQGEFSAGEPVAAVFAWVADCLSDPLHTYELVLPNRQTLAVEARSVREADLVPSVALLFRWTGQSAMDMAHVPALRQELLRAARPATAAY